MNEPVYSPECLRDPEIFAIGRLDAVSDHDIFRSAAEADMGAGTLCRSLNGMWRFSYSETPSKRPAGFQAEDFDVSGWSEIRVPGHIELQGYGTPQYVNVQYPWDGHEQLEWPAIPAERNPVGCYARFFDMPARPSEGERIVLRFDGVECAFFCWLNGVFIGYSEDSFTPSRFDVTRAIRQGENKLAVEVYRFSTASWLEDQDFFRFSGIFRDVTLIAEPRAHVEDVFVHTDLSDDMSDAELRVDLKLALPAAPVTLRAALIKGEATVDEFETRAESSMTLKRHISAPLLWSAEKPELYTLRLTLAEGGAEVEVAQTRVGFRRFEIKDGLMLLNGRRILLHGVDRHEFCAEHGRALPVELMLRDVLQMKRSNINAVRTSHYPNHPAWYRLCDEYGIYLIDECNLETHGTWLDVPKHGKERVLPGDNPEWLPAVLDRARSMQERDKNHPSVLIWSCGNESFGGKDIFEMSELLRRRDPDRPVHYEGIYNDRSYPATSDIESRMYPPASEIAEYLSEHTDKPYILCEYAHAMGNSVGALHKYTALEDAYPQYQGAFIWDYVDQALLTTAPNGKPRLGYGGDFGDRPCDRDFSGNGLMFADRTATPKLQEVKYLYQDVRIVPDEGGVTLTNRYLFTNTSEFTLRWRLMRNGEAVQAGALDAPDVPAGETRRFALPVMKPTLQGEYCLHCGLYLRVPARWADCDYELMHGEAVIADIPREAEALLPDYAVSEGDCNIGARGEGFETLICRAEGGISSLRGENGRELLMTAPMLSLFRAPTSNDAGNRDDAAECLWLPASLYGRGKYTGHECINGFLRVNFTHALPLTGGAEIKTEYTVLGRGRVRVRMTFAGKAGLPDMGSFGLCFRLPAELKNARYYGLGPDECYPDRHMGAKLGIHGYAVGDNLTRYLNPQECGAREGVRWFELTDESGRGLRVERDNEPLSISALPNSAIELLWARHPDELPAQSYTYLDVALRRKGVGGDDSWGAPVHPEYHIRADKPMSLSFVLSVIS